MDPNIAIEVRNISKSFKIEVEDFDRKATIMNRVPTKVVERRIIDNVSLNVRKGDVLGILGCNGAGKSTLLALIARIMKPDTGTIEVSGKIATILELGMGFHQDMSGRENIYLKAELYGFSRSQVDERIDKIIEYSGISDYIDNPVRTYSSGMSGRLAFAIMVNLDSDIILVDEILSVGDLAFSTKAREHFRKMATSGKTVIFVSHNIDFVESMCNRAIWLEKGKIIKDGPAKQICSEYRNKINDSPEVISDLAIAGVSDSQYRLGLMYRDGGVFGQSEELYEKWIKDAAIHGHTKAQVEYAGILFSKGDLEGAVEYYNQAAIKGDNDAKNKISMLSLPKTFGIEQLIDIFRQISKTGNCLNEYRYATLLLKAAWSNEDRKAAFNIFVKAAEHGSPDAMHQVAVMYRDGVGTSKDVKKMEEYYQKGANSGFIPSMVALGDIYSQGKLLAKDESSAFNYLLKAAKFGDVSCMYRVANSYREGIGVLPNEEESNYWFDKYVKALYYSYRVWAIDYIRSGSIETEYKLSDLYVDNADSFNNGAIISLIYLLVSEHQPVDKYVDILKFKAENHNIDAIKRVGNLYYDGVGVEKNYSVALKWYTMASNLGDLWSKLRLGDMYRDGKGTDIDIDRALSLYFEVGNQGNVAALSNIISISTSKPSIDSSLFYRAFEMLRNTAISGNLEAIKRVGNLYYDGIGVSKDYSEALYWYVKAALLGDSWTKNRLCEMIRDGKVSNTEFSNYSNEDMIGYDVQRALDMCLESVTERKQDTLYKLSALCMNSDDESLKQFGKTCLALSLKTDDELAAQQLTENVTEGDLEPIDEIAESRVEGTIITLPNETKTKPVNDNEEPFLKKLQDKIEENVNQQDTEKTVIAESKGMDQESDNKEAQSVDSQVHNYPDGTSYRGNLDQNGLFSGFGVCA